MRRGGGQAHASTQRFLEADSLRKICEPMAGSKYLLRDRVMNGRV
jgi:hypothetical protein